MTTTARETIEAVLRGTLGYEAGLDALLVAPPARVDPALTAALRDACAARWQGGWQPVELHRTISRRGQPIHAELVTDAVAAQLRRFPRPPSTRDGGSRPGRSTRGCGGPTTRPTSASSPPVGGPTGSPCWMPC
ncbi:hypothetical protein [Micromonospora zhanjiangensis]